jgi:hypothetical protein
MCPLEFVNLVYSWKNFSILVHFDRISTESSFWATNFGTLPAEGVKRRKKGRIQVLPTSWAAIAENGRAKLR